MGYATVIGRYIANFFGGNPNSQKQDKKNGAGENVGNIPPNLKKRASINTPGSRNSFGGGAGGASQGDTTSNTHTQSHADGSIQKLQVSLKRKSRSQSRQDATSPNQAPSNTPSAVVPIRAETVTEISRDDHKVYLKNKLDNRDSVDLCIFENFELKYVRFLGAGGQGEVHQVIDCITKKQFALKIIKQNSAAKKYEKEALEVIQVNSHPGIIHLEACLEDDDFLYLLTQFVEGLTVRDIIPYMEQFSWERKREFVIPLLAELCLSIDFLHQLGYVHRDIKASNCFLDMFGHVTIGDFGSCIHKTLIKARVIFGTVPYTISPEMFSKVAYGVEADYWGIGVLACELLLGFFPFDWFTRDEIKSRETVNDVIQTIKSPQIPPNVPDDVKHVLYDFLTADPKRRLGSPSLGGIESIQRHPFFSGIHWERFRNESNRCRALPVLKLMKAIQKKKAAKAEQAAAAAAARAAETENQDRQQKDLPTANQSSHPSYHPGGDINPNPR